MDVRFSPRAAAQIESRRTWWHKHRTERDVFDDELAAAIATLRDRAASFAIVRERHGRAIRRVLMPRAGCHLYFEVSADVITVVSAWGATRGREPRL